ncbi:MAG: hypothetical protein JW900_08810 [Anaerolineae bacterium]|nr:hypothetical protein [Anaerolineae bacterium]
MSKKKSSISSGGGGGKRPSSIKPTRPSSKPTRPSPGPSRPAPRSHVSGQTPKRPVSKTPRPTARPPAAPPPKAPRPVQKAVRPPVKQPRPGAPGRATHISSSVSAAERAQQKQLRRQQRRNLGGVGFAAGVAAGAAAGTAAGAMVGEGGAEKLNELSERLAALQQGAALVSVYEDLEDTDSALYALPGQVAAVRTQEYAFANYLEHKVETLSAQWAEVKERVAAAVEQRSADLQGDVNEAESALQRAYSGGSAQIGRAESAIRQLESKVTAAQQAIEAMFDTIDDNVTQVMGQLEQINWTLEQAREASFDFYEGEDFVAACRAQLLEQGDEGPEGILYLTDERLAFEQKEEVATKKFLFITTEKETLHEFVFAELVGHVEEVRPSEARAGLMGRKEILDVLFAPDATISDVKLRLIQADSDEWARLIKKVKSGEIERERVRAEGEETAPVEELTVQVEEIPTKCPNCGAAFTTPIVRGMREIVCGYCSTVVRL